MTERKVPDVFPVLVIKLGYIPQPLLAKGEPKVDSEAYSSCVVHDDVGKMGGNKTGEEEQRSRVGHLN